MILPFRRRQNGARFVHPVQPVPRTAILRPGFAESKLVRVFSSGWTEDAARFGPASVAGSVDDLRQVARDGFVLQHSVVVLTTDDKPELSSDDREYLWQTFGVPIFEQQLGPNNELIASECDAHNGLHMAGDFPSLRRDKNSCACGNPAPRLPRRKTRFQELEDLLA